MLSIFFKTLSETIDCCAPLTKITKKELALQLKRWINEKTKDLIRKRYKLLLKYCTSEDEIQKMTTHNKFKKLKNNINYLIRKSKNENFKIHYIRTADP